jgi:large subunit ribosomal protein L23
MTSMDRFYRVIRKPLITEKATDDSTWRNTYHFRVPVDANKVEIRQAVEKLFDVKVLSVNTLRVPQKWRRRGYSVGHTPQWKKAMVQLREEDKIEVL